MIALDTVTRLVLYVALVIFAVYGVTYLAPKLAAGFSNHIEQAVKPPKQVSL